MLFANVKNRQLLTICLNAYNASGSPHKAELARTKFQLAKVMKRNGALEQKYTGLDHESRLMLSEVRKNKGVVSMDSTKFVDADFDNEVQFYQPTSIASFKRA